MTDKKSIPLRHRITPTMDDIARIANVDKSTVSRALSGNKLVAEGTRAHVRRVAEEHGYIVNTVAAGLRSRKTKVIAVVVPLAHGRRQSMADPFLMELVGHLADDLAAQGYDLLLAKTSASHHSRVAAFYLSRKADGVILIGQNLEHDHANSAARQGVPLVAWGAKIRGQAYISVGTHNRKGGELATQHLIDTGRKHIAFAGNRKMPEISQRYDGYAASLKGAGIELNPAWITEAPYELAEASKSITALLKNNQAIDAIVAASDMIALAAIQAITALGLRVPQDIAVTGFDDVALASHTIPPLTTVRQDISRGTKLLSEKILGLVEGRSVKSVEMTPSLVIRQSA